MRSPVRKRKRPRSNCSGAEWCSGYRRSQPLSSGSYWRMRTPCAALMAIDVGEYPVIRLCSSETRSQKIYRAGEASQFRGRGLRALAKRGARDMPLPVYVVAIGEVAAEVHAAGLLADQGRIDHQPGDRQQVLHFPPGPVFEGTGEHVPAPKLDAVAGLEHAV